MNKKKLYKIKRNLIKKIKYKPIDDESKKLLNTLGFKVLYDDDYNLYLWDNINNEIMYTNTLVQAGIPYRSSENKYFLLEFVIVDKHITNLKLYRKRHGYNLIFKKN